MSRGKRSLRDIASVDADLDARINEIWRIAGELQWAQAGATTQGREHCERVERNAMRLLQYIRPKTVCTPTIAFILSAAAALHDIGKIVRGTSAPKPLGDHGAESKRRILENTIGIPFPDREFQKIIADVVGVHANEPFSSILAESRQCNSQEVWPRSLAAVFRLADMLDTGKARTPLAYCEFMGALFDRHPEVWIARSSITGWTCDEDRRKVLLQAHPPSPAAARAVEKLVKMTNADLHKSHKKALTSLQFSRTTSPHPPIVCHLPTKVCLVQRDRNEVRRLARQLRRGYVIRDRTIVVRGPENDRFGVEEQFHIQAMEPINRLTMLLAVTPVSVSQMLVDNKPTAPTILDRTVEAPKAINENMLAKVELRYEATERVVLIDPKLDVLISATLTFRAPLGHTLNVSAFAITAEGPRTPFAASPADWLEGEERVIEYRISEADPALMYQFTW